MKKNLRDKKGITLITLVVTIVVLIILVGITVNVLLGENGIIKRAQSGAEKQEIAQIKEKIQLEIAAAESDAIIRGENLEKTQLNEIISKYGELQSDEDTIITTQGNHKISLKEIWYGVISESGSYTDKVEQIKQLEAQKELLEKKLAELEELNAGNSQIINSLNNQIASLNNTLTQFKTAIAEAITKQGVETSPDATSATMSANIAKVAENKYNQGITDGRVGYYTADQYNASYTNGYNAGKSDSAVKKATISLSYNDNEASSASGTVNIGSGRTIHFVGTTGMSTAGDTGGRGSGSISYSYSGSTVTVKYSSGGGWTYTTASTTVTILYT